MVSYFTNFISFCLCLLLPVTHDIQALCVTVMRKHVGVCKGGSRAMLLGGARTVGGVRARRCEAPSSKCDQGSAKRLPKELRQGSGGAKIGLLES